MKRGMIDVDGKRSSSRRILYNGSKREYETFVVLQSLVVVKRSIAMTATTIATTTTTTSIATTNDDKGRKKY